MLLLRGKRKLLPSTREIPSKRQPLQLRPADASTLDGTGSWRQVNPPARGRLHARTRLSRTRLVLLCHESLEDDSWSASTQRDEWAGALHSPSTCVPRWPGLASTERIPMKPERDTPCAVARQGAKDYHRCGPEGDEDESVVASAGHVACNRTRDVAARRIKRNARGEPSDHLVLADHAAPPSILGKAKRSPLHHHRTFAGRDAERPGPSSSAYCVRK